MAENEEMPLPNQIAKAMLAAAKQQLPEDMELAEKAANINFGCEIIIAAQISMLSEESRIAAFNDTMKNILDFMSQCNPENLN